MLKFLPTTIIRDYSALKTHQYDNISIVWFRQDLRISDNPTLVAASSLGKILPIYILDDCAPALFKVGSGSRVWLHHSLSQLNKSLQGNLNCYTGKASEIIDRLIKQYNIKNIFWNICYEPWHLKQENAVQNICNKLSVQWQAFNANYLWCPRTVLKDDRSYYKIFTAYKNKSHHLTPRASVTLTKKLNFLKDSKNKTHLSDFHLIPKNHWAQKIEKLWDIGESAAQDKLEAFIEKHLLGYKEGRNHPAKEQTSKLSPHLHFGEISVAHIMESVKNYGHLYADESDVECFLNEIIWREFSCYLLYHCPSLHTDNFNDKFTFPNLIKPKQASSFLKAWQTGHTGYPFIDAGMRELWQTGYMHNRVRMLVASFLVKNMNIHWHKGRDWFWDCLIDADLANNSTSWQWVAGCGVDAAPYFRIFNPITQGEKFDTQGHYTRRFVPELKNMPDKYLFKPWAAPENILKSAGVVLGKTYPEPIIDWMTSRNRTLEAYYRSSV